METCEQRRAREYGIEEYPVNINEHTATFHHTENLERHGMYGLPHTVDSANPAAEQSPVQRDYTTLSDPTAHFAMTSNVGAYQNQPHDPAERVRFIEEAILARELRDAADAHHVWENEQKNNRQDADWSDPNWPDWYAHHIVASRS